MEFEILRLHLAAPLVFASCEGAEIQPDPFAQIEGGSESLFCFGLEPSESLKFEPDLARLLGDPETEKNTLLPAGLYMFSQMRQRLKREEILEMAAEIQKEALWQRLILEPRLYLRYLHEDGRGVTQVFRPFKEASED
ncbi:hypothetical protein [Leadbettera azotonutricia]|uniref:Putative lipoprotein n=1 Tax=Leadbettera azotonutricia (strain ATCC BAA-888 / DSM 13862 / ZAS-9) TaxID=545695 RepID=F5Y8Q0_LEAAZ|nr:hypothetical protein [Leadbettera azotonutricia]AEF80228.1 putative lipoprotein [Leadbettera azotonutricia ZAS-9]